MSRFDLPLGVGGLHNTFGGAATPDGFWRRSWNATAEDGRIGARPGIWDVLPFVPNETAWGAGYGQWGAHRVLVRVLRRGLAVGADLTIHNPVTWLPVPTPAAALGTLNATGYWTFLQDGNSMLGMNAADGIWRLGPLDGPASWTRVPMRWQLARGDPVRRVVGADPLPPLAWTAERTALVSGWPDAFRGATTAAVDVAGDAMTFTIEPVTGRTSRDTLLRFGADFGAATDFRTSRTFSFTMSVAISETEPRPHENFRYLERNSPGRLRAFASTDPTAPPGALDDPRWREVGIQAVARSAEGASLQGTATVDVVVDMDRGQRRSASGPHDSASWLQNIRRWMVVIPGASGNGHSVVVSELARGGVFLSKPDFQSPLTLTPFTQYGPRLNELRYVVQYCANAAPFGSGGGFQEHRMHLEDTAGPTASEGGGHMGSRALVSFQAGAGPFAPSLMPRVRVWRRRWSDSSRWWLILDAPNAAGTFLDANVDDLWDAVPWPTTTTLPATQAWDFSQGNLQDAAQGEIRPTCGAQWKTHLVVGAGRWVYFSQANNPGVFAPRPDDDRYEVDIDDDTGPRTVVMASDRADVVVGIAAADALYLVGERATSVMVGDTARSATPPRLLPNSRGAPSPQAVTTHDGGVLVGAEDGLWWYRADLSTVHSSDTVYQSAELTSGIRESWDSFWYSDLTRPVVVTSHEGEIWVVRGVRYLRRTRDGAWEEGAWSGDALGGGRRPGASGDPLFPEPGTALPPGPGPGDGGPGAWPPAQPPVYTPPPPQTCDANPENWTLSVVPQVRWQGPTASGESPLANSSGGSTGPGTLTMTGQVHVYATWIGSGPAPDRTAINLSSWVWIENGAPGSPMSADNGLGDPASGGPNVRFSQGTEVRLGVWTSFDISASTSNTGSQSMMVHWNVGASIQAGGCP